MRITPRRSESSRYDVKVQIDTGQARYGILTYDLLAPERGRGMALLSADSFSSDLTRDQAEALNTLRRIINDSFMLNAEGRTARAKSTVRMLAAGEINYPYKGIAV